MKIVKRIVLAGMMWGLCGAAAGAQQGRQYTTGDYKQAEKFMQYNVNPLVYHSVDQPVWLADGRFWYRDYGPDGATYMLVDPAKRTKGPAFDHAKLAAALTTVRAGGRVYSARSLHFVDFRLENSDQTVIVNLGETKMRCDLSGQGSCTQEAGQSTVRPPGVPSPDGTNEAFIRDYNLWVADTKTGAETQLTTDGVKDYGYATDNAGWTHSEKAVLLWSPDSKKIATFQQDQRKVGEMYLVPVTNRHPELEAWKYPLAGDANVTMIDRVVIDVATRKIVRLKMPPDQHRSTICDDVACPNGATTWDDVQWSEDGTHLAFVSTARDHRQEWVRIADTETGDVREVMNETAQTFLESGVDHVNWRYLPRSNELIWYSECDGWGQLYLYDLATGRLKNQITHGEGNVTQILQVDEKTRTIYFVAVGKEKGRDPYFEHLYRVGFDGKGMKLLTPEDADHAVTASDDGQYFVDVYSTATQPQTAVVRDQSGKIVMEVAKQDITKLVADGWKPPMPIKVKARDGKTDLYGFLFKPTSFEAAKRYPIVNFVYPGPQTGSCGSRSFTAAHRDNQALAELGFVVVCIDGMGTPYRSRAFHDAYNGNLSDNTIPDQVAGMKELAARYKWIDLGRAGIYGHSGGGYATATAMFRYPDFFKVGIAESGNYDNREYEDDWAEKWVGLEVRNPDGTSNYDSQAVQRDAKNLKGHLLLAHGTMDDNVPMNNTLLVVDALIKANKDFDLLLIPNAAHSYGAANQYMTRRRWDYFVRYLAGGTPPEQYEMMPYGETLTRLTQSGP